MDTIAVNHLSMRFRAPVRPEGLRAAVRSLRHREYREIAAVQDVSFRIEAGEIVGFLGPNGAGKTTTLKILSGILHPTEGSAIVRSFTPWERKPAFLSQIAMVRGSRAMSGPGELTVLDSLRFQQLVYEVPDSVFRTNLAELVDMLDLSGILQRQVRALSLGERMRAGLAMALIYRPGVLFLDEPTIGLDVSAISVVRTFIKDYARQTGATVMLTSHFMADVEELCPRVILIDRGTVHYDGELHALKTRLMPFKDIRVLLSRAPDSVPAERWSQYGEVLAQNDGVVHLRVARDAVPAATSQVLATGDVVDLSVSDPSLESVIQRAYREEVS